MGQKSAEVNFQKKIIGGSGGMEIEIVVVLTEDGGVFI